MKQSRIIDTSETYQTAVSIFTEALLFSRSFSQPVISSFRRSSSWQSFALSSRSSMISPVTLSTEALLYFTNFSKLTINSFCLLS